MGSCFVTCGATVPFPDLVECMLSDEVMGSLYKSGFTRLIIQYGKGYDDEFDSICLKLDKLKQQDGEELSKLFGENTTARFYRFTEGPLQDFEILGFPYSNDIVSLLDKHADVVVSHAGTGSILDSLRLNKQLIVVVNHSLMDNHQQQTAQKFEQLGHVLSVSPNVKELCSAIECIKGANLKPLENEPNQEFLNRLRNIVY